MSSQKVKTFSLTTVLNHITVSAKKDKFHLTIPGSTASLNNGLVEPETWALKAPQAQCFKLFASYRSSCPVMRRKQPLERRVHRTSNGTQHVVACPIKTAIPTEKHVFHLIRSDCFRKQTA